MADTNITKTPYPLKRVIPFGETIETSLRDNIKVVITEHGISPALLLGELPISLPREKNGRSIKQTDKGSVK